MAKKKKARKTKAKPRATKAKRKSGLTQMTYSLSPELQAVVGSGKLTRPQVVKKLWAYIKKNKLQDPKNKRDILADSSLKAVFNNKAKVNMFEMTKLVNKHLK